MPETKILIVGGGAAGLSMAGSLKHEGLDAVVLDASAKTGDVWRNRYDRLHLHTVKGFSHSTHKKMDKSLPRYVPKDDFANYLADYAQEFDLDIRHNCKVTRISKSESGYQVETENGETWQCEHLIMATGINGKPFTPEWDGLETFKGRVMHSSAYQSGKEFAGQRVLVVGIGNSGGEICVDLLEHGTQVVDNSIRTFPMVVKRDMLGVPVHVWGILLFRLPMFIKETLLKLTVAIEVGDLSKWGMKTPEWSVFKDSRIPMIDVGYIKQLKAGKIQVKPDIECLTETGVKFTDGTQVDYDAIIAGTGYRTGLDHIMDLPNILDDKGKVIAENGDNAPHKNLWFVGYMDSPAGILMYARIQAQRLAEKIASL